MLQELEAEAPPGQLILAQVTAPLQQDLQHRPMQATGMNQASDFIVSATTGTHFVNSCLDDDCGGTFNG